MITVAALYIDPRGPYPALLGAEYCWDEQRDARLYDGPHPVVAHPPCRHWSRLRHLAHVDCVACGSSYSARENEFCPNCGSAMRVCDADCAPRAVEQVRLWGGVIEHPKGSKLWGNGDELGEGGMLPPVGCRDTHRGYTIELDQVEWGHACRKRTWLYLVGVPRKALEAPPFPGREPTHWFSGFREAGKAAGASGYKRSGCAVPPGIKVASAQQRRRTPPLFAEYLVRLARAAGEARRAA